MSAIENLDEIIDLVIKHDRLACVAITSSARGKYSNEGFKFGMGKSTLAYLLIKRTYEKYHPFGKELATDLTRMNFGYTWDDMDDMFRRGYEQRIFAYCQDDFQNIAGKFASWNKDVIRRANFMTTARPFLGLFVSTQPDIGQLAKCWREVYMVEIKVPLRGHFECHIYDSYSPFGDPLNPRVRLIYKSEGTFPDLDKEDHEWYHQWRSIKSEELGRSAFEPLPEKEKPEPIDTQWKRLKEAGLIDCTREVYRSTVKLAAA